MLSYKRINKYLKIVESSFSKRKHDEYNEIRKKIEEHYKSQDREYIEQELERVTNNLEINKLPYMGMLISIFALCFTIIVNNVFIDALKQLNPIVDHTIIFLYGFAIIIIFGLYFIYLERNQQCYYIAKSVLKEMLISKE